MDNNFDVIIVGTGAAGLFAGLCLPVNLNVLMITKDKMCIRDSNYSLYSNCIIDMYY